MEPTVISKIEEEIIKLQKDWIDACLKKNPHVCDEILSDDFILHSARGMAKTKAEWMNDLHNPKTDLKVLELLGDPQVKQFGDVCIVRSIIRQKGIWGDKDFTGDFLLLDVWVNRNDNWKLFARQGTLKV